MATFLIRTQLNTIGLAKPSDSTYDHVHDSLAEMGAIRKIVADDGSVFDTPRATYILVSSASLADVRDEVARRVEAQWSNVDTLVVEYSAAAWKLSPSTSGSPFSGLLGMGLGSLGGGLFGK